MSPSIHKKRNSALTALQSAKMREELINFSEKERILRERSAIREVYQYLLDAYRVAARPDPHEEILDMPPIVRHELNQFVVSSGAHLRSERGAGNDACSR